MRKLILITGLGLATALATADITLAKGGNGGGNGNGNGGSSASSNGGGNGGGSSNGNGNRGNGSSSSRGNGNSSSATQEQGTPRAVPPGQQRRIQRASTTETEETPVHVPPGQLRRALGALNAAHASEQALEHASPNSRVGRVAAYRDQILAVDEAGEALEEAEELLASLPEPDRSREEVADDLLAAQDRVAAAEDELDDLARQLEEAGGRDPDIEAQIADTIAELDAAHDEVAALEEEEMLIDAYEDAEAQVAELESEVENGEQTARDLLEAAANKPVTDEVEDEVLSLLGLPPRDREEEVETVEE